MLDVKSFSDIVVESDLVPFFSLAVDSSPSAQIQPIDSCHLIIAQRNHAISPTKKEDQDTKILPNPFSLLSPLVNSIDNLKKSC